VRAGVGGREVFPGFSGGQSNPAGLASESEIEAQPDRMGLKSLMLLCRCAAWREKQVAQYRVR